MLSLLPMVSGVWHRLIVIEIIVLVTLIELKERGVVNELKHFVTTFDSWWPKIHKFIFAKLSLFEITC